MTIPYPPPLTEGNLLSPSSPYYSDLKIQLSETKQIQAYEPVQALDLSDLTIEELEPTRRGDGPRIIAGTIKTVHG
jgi:hypothetical protein